MNLLVNRIKFLVAVLLVSGAAFPVFSQYPQSGRPGNSPRLNIGRFYGKVVDDATGQSIGYASVQLYAMHLDSLTHKMQNTLLAGQLTLENGDFSLENLPIRKEYTLKITFLGYAEMEKKISFDMPDKQDRGSNPAATLADNFDKDLGNIRLAASASLLKEVTIEGEASQVSLALDKKIYRVDKDNVAAGGTAEDALKNVPTLNVDIDGNLTMRNAAPQLFIDGRPTDLTLDQIPADAIESVEVITNPSAKYDASGGGAGIVNIVLKKEHKIGYNGSVRAGVDMRGRANLGGNVNARQGKFNVFLGANLNQRRSLSTAGTDRYNIDFDGTPTSNVHQTNAPQFKGFFGMTRAGIDWFIDNRNTLSLNGNIHGGSFNTSDVLYRDELFFPDTLPQYTISSQRESFSKRNFQSLGGQLSYKHLFPKEGKEWTADINYRGSDSKNNGDFQTTYSNLTTPSKEKQNGDGGNQYITIQTDLVDPITKSIKLEAGARAAIRDYNTNNANYRYDPLQDIFYYVPGFTDKYKFDDQVYAAYGTFTQSFQKWGYQVGLRAESSAYSGTLIDRDTTFRNNYPLSLFPSIFVTYKLNEEDNLQVSLTRRINRPNFFQLIPFTDFSDSLNLSMGNPDLVPEFTNSAELSYQNIFNRDHNLLFSVFYKQATDLITRYTYSEYDAQLQRTIGISTFENANSSKAYGAELTVKNTFWKKLELTTNVNLYNSVLDINEEGVGNSRSEQLSWSLKENLNYKLPANFTIQINGSYRSRTNFDVGGGDGGHGGWFGGSANTAQGYTLPVWYVDASIRKDFWNRKASITASIQDIFRSRKSGSHTESTLFTQDSWRRRDSQLVRVNFSYRFGKMDVSLFKRKNNREESDNSMDVGY